ncbi:MAG: alcohol dehydrogenase catalytic domain-containing protein [Candidatus Magnetoovum sp. WYHC-5]|nr:alcohol dehydrogenase catalytic domain-containing protein [Candidatus Magnetoovum sp. WYHC-5]
MQALVVDAKWQPKDEYPITECEVEKQRANIGSLVWKDPVFEVRDVPMPIIGHDEILIKVKRCGICGSDTHLYETSEDGYVIFSGPVKLPCVIGHEYSGIVVEKGKSVQLFNVGDKVAAESIYWCGICTACRSGNLNQCEHVELTGVTTDGAMAEYARAKERHCWSINAFSENYDDEEAFEIGALIEPVGCAYNGIFIGGGGFKPGANVAIYGVGPIGLAAVALTKLAGANKIIAFDVSNERLAIAKKLGADYVYNIDNLKKDGVLPSYVVLKLTAGGGADINIEAAGAANFTIPEMEHSMAVNGKIIYLGRAETVAPILLNTFVSGANSIVGVRGHSGYGIYNNIIRLMASKRLDLRDVITSHFDLSDVLGAIKKSTDRKDGKILVRF